MDLENHLKNRIPFGEACAFLVEFHKLGEEVDMAAPPPAPDVLGLMAAVVQNEFRSLLAYTVYAQTLRDLSREGLAEEFQEHADEELEHAEFLLRRMAVLGGQPPLQDVPAPAPASDPVEIVNNLIQIEQESIASWQALHAAVGEDPSKYKIEEYLAVEQEHLDDMLRLLPGGQPAAPPPIEAGAAGGPMASPDAPPPAAGPAGASVKVDLKPGGGGGEKVAFSYALNDALARKYMGKSLAEVRAARGQEKVAFRDPSVHPGTERYHSARMLAVLQGLPSKSYTPEGALEGVVDKYGHPVVEKWASSFKAAADEMMGAPSDGAAPPQQGGAPGSQLQGDPRTSAWLQNEMEGQQAQGVAGEEYYKQRFAEASQQLEAATQASEQAAQQAAQLQQQAEQNQMALSSAQNQSQQATALAMQQVMQAGDEKLQQQQQAAQMRMAFQDLRGQLMNLASQEPPTQVLNDPAAQAPQAGPAAPGTQAMGGQNPPSTEPQDAASAPAGQAPDPASPPGTAQPGQAGASGSTSANQGSESSDASGKGKGSTTVSVKQGSVRDHALGAGLGALIGGAGTALESSGHGDAARANLQKNIGALEQEQGSFPQAMKLVASKAMLASSEAAKAHPVGASIMGSLAGAGIGAATEPAVRSLVESGRRLLG